jgi:hypothetical protein
MKKLSAVWSLLPGVTLWAIWIERNELVFNDETLPIRKKPKHQKREEYKEQNERTHVQKTKEPPKRANHKGNIKFLNPLLSSDGIRWLTKS